MDSLSQSTDVAPIFVTGTGRSGTWILYKTLACHPDVHTFPREMRFLIDPDGLLDLVDVLTTRFHPAQARESLYRFERLMKVYFTIPENSPYRGFDFPAWLGGAYYWERLEQFLSNLSYGEYDALTWEGERPREARLVRWAASLSGLRRFLDSQSAVNRQLTIPPSRKRIARYFSDREQLINIASSFVDDLFRMAASRHGKLTWSEKTPQNLLCLDFLWDLFPHSCVIHIKRDPRGVVHSLRKQQWAPEDLESACYFLQGVYDRWFDLKVSLDLTSHRFLEISLEDFAASPRGVLHKIAAACGLTDSFSELPKIELSKVTYWQKEMTRDDIRRVNTILGSRIESLGYSL